MILGDAMVVRQIALNAVKLIVTAIIIIPQIIVEYVQIILFVN